MKKIAISPLNGRSFSNEFALSRSNYHLFARDVDEIANERLSHQQLVHQDVEDSEKELSLEQKLELAMIKIISTNQNTIQKLAIPKTIQREIDLFEDKEFRVRCYNVRIWGSENHFAILEHEKDSPKPLSSDDIVTSAAIYSPNYHANGRAWSNDRLTYSSPSSQRVFNVTKDRIVDTPPRARDHDH
ncbi:hypothetical protein TNCV_4806481 [Trichonephila clavipes]|nr:hypothetical protein TNCV_4806481 [Trichonephila clavipes]